MGGATEPKTLVQAHAEGLVQLLGEVLMDHVEPLFTPGVQLTLIARDPTNDAADVLVTSDTIDGLMALLERSRARPDILAKPGN